MSECEQWGWSILLAPGVASYCLTAITIGGYHHDLHHSLTTKSLKTGWSGVKEMDLDLFAARFTSKLPLAALVYDNRGFGASDTKDGAPRHEIIPAQQISDYSDAITYAQSRGDVDTERIGVWGSSYSGGHVLWVGAVDRRVKAVLSQVPMVDGWANFHALIRSDMVAQTNAMFQQGAQYQQPS